MKKKSLLLKSVLPLIFLTSIFIFGQAQDTETHLKSTQDVISWYKGWKDNPDTLNVYIDSTFTNAEKDSINTAIKRWNDAGCKPALKTTDTPSNAQVTFTEANIKPEGTCSYEPTDASKKNESAKITIDSDRKLTLTEVATHELGHVLGLDDTKGAGTDKDVMKDKATNGTDGQLSKHDSTELKLAIARVDANATKDVKTIKESGKKMAFIPGEAGMVSFPIEDFTPEILANSVIAVNVIADPYVDIEIFEIIGNELMVMVHVSPDHWDGMYMLDINITPPGLNEPLQLFGVHYISHNPVPETIFDCPFEIYEENGFVNVLWEGMTSYPHPGELRASFVVDDIGVFHTKGGGNFEIPLNSGQYNFTLHVDDYQGNSASFSQIFQVTGINDFVLNKDSFLFNVFPNPFINSCQIKSDPNCTITVFDLQGKSITMLKGGDQIWQPGSALKSGYYIFQAEKDGKRISKKIKFLK